VTSLSGTPFSGWPFRVQAPLAQPPHDTPGVSSLREGRADFEGRRAADGDRGEGLPPCVLWLLLGRQL
jgi:hypothetical protein